MFFVREEQTNETPLLLRLRARHLQMVHDLQCVLVVIEPEDFLRFATDTHRQRLQLRFDPRKSIDPVLFIREEEANEALIFLRL